MTRFASKAAPSADKLRGGYYTPDPIARYLASWVAKAGTALLEPSCGDGAVLRRLAETAESTDVLGIELVADEAAAAESVSGAHVQRADFFAWFTADQHGRWDGVAGNPPYIRFGNWPEAARTSAFALMEDAGLKPSRLTNAWVPFVVGSVLALRSGGRVGLVLPAELLQVGYASQLREFLAEHLDEIRLVSFKRLVFEGILQEVVLLLGVRGAGPASIKTIEVESAEDLQAVRWSTTSTAITLHDHEKWTKYFLTSSQVDALRAVQRQSGLRRLEDLCGVDVGVVTGRNSFFTMTPTEAEERGVARWCVPLVARSGQLTGITYAQSDLAKQDADDLRTRLLVVPPDVDPSEELTDYLDLGEAEGVPSGYKCSIRKSWWTVPSVWTPDAFMLRQLHTHPRLVANLTGATSTDTVHRVRLAAGVDAKLLATASINSVTFALAEVLGRSYGGGILELEPREAEQLLVPDPSLIPDGLTERVDELLRSGHLVEAADLVDELVLVGRLGIDQALLDEVRGSWQRLRDRRGNRGRAKRSR